MFSICTINRDQWRAFTIGSFLLEYINYTICLGECVDLYVNVIGGDSTSYNYTWNPILSNSPGPHTVCPIITTQYIVTVDDLGPATAQSDTVIITVLPSIMLIVIFMSVI